MISWILQIDKFGTLIFTKDTVCWEMFVNEGNVIQQLSIK